MYSKKIQEVEAIQLNEAVFDDCGNKLANKGDWLVIEGDEQYYMTNEDFNKEFMKKEEPITVTWPYTTPTITIKPFPDPCPPSCDWNCSSCCNWHCCNRRWDYTPKWPKYEWNNNHWYTSGGICTF